MSMSEPVRATYNELFGTPALGPPRDAIFFRVYSLAAQRLGEAQRAVEEARSAFYRGDHPFDYEIGTSASEAGGQSE